MRSGDKKTTLNEKPESYRLIGMRFKRPRITIGTPPAHGRLIFQQLRCHQLEDLRLLHGGPLPCHGLVRWCSLVGLSVLRQRQLGLLPLPRFLLGTLSTLRTSEFLAHDDPRKATNARALRGLAEGRGGAITLRLVCGGAQELWFF